MADKGMLLHMTQLPDLMERARSRTLGNMQQDPELEELMRMRREGQRQRQLQSQQEMLLGPSPEQDMSLAELEAVMMQRMGLK
jgi:hypothetical protein